MAGFMNWLGRQVAYVKKAVKTDVGPQVVYRKKEVIETQVADRPDEKLRRTIVDEVVRQEKT